MVVLRIAASPGAHGRDEVCRQVRAEIAICFKPFDKLEKAVMDSARVRCRPPFFEVLLENGRILRLFGPAKQNSRDFPSPMVGSGKDILLPALIAILRLANEFP
ncbi:hypothetical protein LH128_27366 [Sphingomonas sp. LH128]|nr:hypothetical protein LH128_27366 [Sphingomonas sp. LH128]